MAIHMATQMAMGAVAMTIETPALLLLLNWLSPVFPVGGFAYSHGLETAIADGRVTTAADLESWISDLVQRGSAWNDAVLFALCWRDDAAALNAHALALSASAERWQESRELGRAFSAALAAWGGAPAAGDWAYPIAAGAALAAAGVPKQHAVAAFLQGFCSMQVSVAVRLVPLGQSQGLAVLHALAPAIAEVGQWAARATLADLGSCCLAADIAAMHHETLSPRIFRT